MVKLALALVFACCAFKQSGPLNTYGDAKAFIDRHCSDAAVAWVEATPIPGKPGLYGAPYRAGCEWE